MTEEPLLTGRCLCGAVKVTGRARTPDVTACHCDMCRRWSAGPYLEITCEQIHFEGDQNIGRFHSSEWAERGYCKECGTNLFYHIAGADDYQISVGLLDDQSKLRFSLQVFTDSKPDFYTFANKTKMMTSAEVFAKYAPPPQ